MHHYYKFFGCLQSMQLGTLRCDPPLYFTYISVFPSKQYTI